MPRVGVAQFAGLCVQNRREHGHEKPFRVLDIQFAVRPDQRFRRAEAGHQFFPDQRLCYGHKDRRGNAFAGDVAHKDADAGFAQPEAVVEIAADCLCGPGRGPDPEISGFQGALLRHQAVLDAAGHVQLHAVLHLVPGQGFDIVDVGTDIRRHFLKGFRDFADLVPVRDVQRFRFLPAVQGKTVHAVGNGPERMDDPPFDKEQKNQEDQDQRQGRQKNVHQEIPEDELVFQEDAGLHAYDYGIGDPAVPVRNVPLHLQPVSLPVNAGAAGLQGFVNDALRNVMADPRTFAADQETVGLIVRGNYQDALRAAVRRTDGIENDMILLKALAE